MRAAGSPPPSREIAGNLLDRLRSGEPAFPGIVGFDDTVLPELETALLAGHDLVLLGERGQGKTRLMRTLWAAGRVESRGRRLRDPRQPVRTGLRALPPAGTRARRRPADRLASPRRPLHREARDARTRRVGDLIGDVDPVKVAQGRTLGDPETVHYGLVPRANRGVFGLNELPDLAERIQVALFNVLEERDIQVRGYSLRLPLDLMLVATANPEDYTNRGRIITPLKDRFGAELRTHYLTEIDDEVALLRQEAELSGEVGDHLLEVLARLSRNLRESASVDQRSGVSARFAIAAAEGVAASALRRAARAGDDDAVARVCDLAVVLPTLLGKVEFEMGEEGRERDVLEHLLRMSVAATFRDRLTGLDLSGFTQVFAEGAVVESGDLVPARDLLAQLGTVPGLAKTLTASDTTTTPDRGRSPPRRSSSWRACTSPGESTRSRSTGGSSTGVGDAAGARRGQGGGWRALPLRSVARRPRPAGAALRRPRRHRPDRCRRAVRRQRPRLAS